MLRNVIIGGLIAAVGVFLLGVIYLFVSVQSLPSYAALAKYRPPVTTRVHAGDGSLIAEFATEQRIFVPIADIPEGLKRAFLSAEDKGFYEHGGIDVWGVLRGTLGNAVRGRRLTGGSTITQQVAKNMLLSSDRTIGRKVKEAFLAQRIEKAFDKDRILELYMNEVYLGQRAYGVAAAALNYFNKPLSELTIAEQAYLAGVLKGPANYDPVTHKAEAITRRNYVIGRMAANKYITPEEAKAAKAADLIVSDRLSGERYVAAAHFVEELRRQVIKDVGGDKAVNEGGLSIRSTMNTDLQVAGARALRRGLEDYDRRHGWRGPIDSIDAAGDVRAQLRKLDAAPPITGWRRAMITAATAKDVKIVTDAGEVGSLAPEDVRWAAAGAKREGKRTLKAGSAIYVEALDGGKYGLRQKPLVEGALVAMDPHTGRVLAMVGGYSFAESSFNRATQAKRQPGSTFKPVVYAAALDYGFTPATLIDDAPLEIIAGDGKTWAPDNYTKQFYGPSTLRTGLEKSLNNMTARIALELGKEKVLEYGQRLGLYGDKTQAVDAMSLGAVETDLTKMVAAYAMFVNGGKRVQPQLVDRIQDREGKTVFSSERRACEGCDAAWSSQAPPLPADEREEALNPVTAYQIVSMLEGVVQRGTGGVVKAVGKPIAGKTGTTNDYKDAWFVGFSPDLVVGVWIGFDKPKTLGEGETGGTLAAPVFRDFMIAALKNEQGAPFRIPPGVRLVRIDQKTGQLPSLDSENIILEAFQPGTEPGAEGAPSPFQFSGGGEEGFDLRAFTELFPGTESGAAQATTNPEVPEQVIEPGAVY